MGLCTLPSLLCYPYLDRFCCNYSFHLDFSILNSRLFYLRYFTHPSVVALVHTKKVILQDLHPSGYPGVYESASEHLQLRRSIGLCSGNRCSQTADQDPQEKRTTTTKLHETQTRVLASTYCQVNIQPAERTSFRKCKLTLFLPETCARRSVRAEYRKEHVVEE